MSVPSHSSASFLCYLQERAAATATKKDVEGELVAAISEKNPQLNELRRNVDAKNASAEMMLVLPVLFPFLPAGVTVVETVISYETCILLQFCSALFLNIAAQFHRANKSSLKDFDAVERSHYRH